MARLHHLDVLRGVAMLGILPVNIAFFALPLGVSDDPGYVSGDAIREYVAYYGVQVLFEYKFITLFSLLFGMGMALMHRSIQARGGSYAKVVLRRLGVLWPLGILHGVALWYGDVVSLYAPLGLMACWAVTWSPRVLALVGGGLVAAVPVVLLGFAGLTAITGWSEVFSQVDGAPPRYDANAPWWEFASICLQAGWEADPDFEIAVFREGSFARIAVLRTTAWFWGGVFGVAYMGGRIVGLFLLGMAAVKSKWIDDLEEARGRLWWIFWPGLVLGGAMQLAAVAVQLTTVDAAWSIVAEVLDYTGSLGLAGAYGAGVFLLVRRVGVSRLLAPLAAVGRTAFSNYVLQSVLMNLVFYSYGLALFARLDRAELWVVVGLVWTVELLVSVLWLRWFRMGPLEWFWRCLTYWRRLPIRVPAE